MFIPGYLIAVQFETSVFFSLVSRLISDMTLLETFNITLIKCAFKFTSPQVLAQCCIEISFSTHREERSLRNIDDRILLENLFI
jgi:hypothetical protein